MIFFYFTNFPILDFKFKVNRFNIDKSLAHLKEALKWRQDNNIDELLSNPPQDFKQLQNEFPIYNDGFDREGRPSMWKIN